MASRPIIFKINEIEKIINDVNDDLGESLIVTDFISPISDSNIVTSCGKDPSDNYATLLIKDLVNLDDAALDQIIASYTELAVNSYTGCGGTNVATTDIMDHLISMQNANKVIIGNIHGDDNNANARGYVK